MMRNATQWLALRRIRASPGRSTHHPSMSCSVSCARGDGTCPNYCRRPQSHLTCPPTTNSNAFPFLSKLSTNLRARTYFTTTDAMKKTNPYHTLGLEWGATTPQIRNAYRRRARELHPDVNTTDAPDVALHKFQTLQKAYSQLMDRHGAHRDDLTDEWQFAVWRAGDRIAEERTDVAGMARKRPVRPAESVRKKNWGVAALGHPDQRSGNGWRRGELLGDGDSSGGNAKSSTVGNGQSKWVKKKEYVPWNGDKS